MWKVAFIVTFWGFHSNRCQFFQCHDDPSYNPDEGPLEEMQYTWLGTLQYIHKSAQGLGTNQMNWFPKNVYRFRDLLGIDLQESTFRRFRMFPGISTPLSPRTSNRFSLFSSINMQSVSLIKNGTPHYFRVPRVVLIARQFVLSTAVDAAQVPEGYALGNVAFGEYERDEAECGLTAAAIAAGRACEPAALLVPLADVLLHPEYKHFGAVHSIAILKLLTSIKSWYMVPVCLPFKNFLVTRSGKPTKDRFYHVDFSNDVPRDIMLEEKEINKLSLLPQELCYLYSAADNTTVPTKERIMCTTGCGFHSGAPSLVHEHTGHWSLIALAQGGSPCPDPLRNRRPPPPPRHILIQPYVAWITAAISGKAVGAYTKDDPFGFVMPRTLPDYNTFGHDWNGHWWMGGLACYTRGDAADMMFKFYHEVFQMKPPGEVLMTYYLELSAPVGTMIICVKIGMPYQIAIPKIWDLDSPEVKIRIPVLKFESMYKLQVEAWGYNATDDEAGSSDSSSSDSDYDEYR